MRPGIISNEISILCHNTFRCNQSFGGKYCIDLSVAAARILGIVRMGFAEVEITKVNETIVPLKAGPTWGAELEFGTVNTGKDYTPEWLP